MKKVILMMLIMLAAGVSSMAQNQTSKVLTNDAVTSVTDTLASDTLMMSESVEVSEPEMSSTNELISELADNLIPIVGIVFVFGMPVLVILIIFVYRHKKQKAQYELIAKAIEAGKDIPEGLFDVKKSEEKNTFTQGIINVFAGIGVSVLLLALVGLKFASIGLLITCIGIGQIIIYRTMSKKEEKTGESQENKQGE